MSTYPSMVVSKQTMEVVPDDNPALIKWKITQEYHGLLINDHEIVTLDGKIRGYCWKDGTLEIGDEVV